MMLNYWDLTEKERAGLTDEELRRYEDIGLMEEGAIRPAPLRLEPEPDYPPIPTTECYRVNIKTGAYNTVTLLVQTEADARTLAALVPRVETTEHPGGNWDETVKVAAPAETTIELGRTVTQQDWAIYKSEYDRIGAIRKTNKAARDAYEKESKACFGVLTALTEDHERCCSLVHQHKRTADTFARYVETANGDRAVARKFLEKALGPEAIQEAEEWLGVNLGSENESEAA